MVRRVPVWSTVGWLVYPGMYREAYIPGCTGKPIYQDVLRKEGYPPGMYLGRRDTHQGGITGYIPTQGGITGYIPTQGVHLRACYTPRGYTYGHATHLGYTYRDIYTTQGIPTGTYTPPRVYTGCTTCT